MDPFDRLSALPGLRPLCDLAWRMFGVNPALVSMDGKRLVLFDKRERAQPFCRALQSVPGGPELCAMCDQSKFLDARRGARSLRYRCHAGLREFIIPVIRDGQIVALLQCGQVHDRAPSASEWEHARKSIAGTGAPTKPLRPLFFQNRVLDAQQQNDLLHLLELIATRLAHADERELGTSPGQAQAALGRAMTFIEAHLSERINIQAVARSANLSTRSLMRFFRKEAGTTVVEFILQRRIARAKQLLQQSGRRCTEVAFECGFGSVQHFNRIFRRLEKVSPTEWRAAQANTAPEGTAVQPGD